MWFTSTCASKSVLTHTYVTPFHIIVCTLSYNMRVLIKKDASESERNFSGECGDGTGGHRNSSSSSINNKSRAVRRLVYLQRRKRCRVSKHHKVVSDQRAMNVREIHKGHVFASKPSSKHSSWCNSLQLALPYKLIISICYVCNHNTEVT